MVSLLLIAHTLAHLVTNEHAANLPIGRVVELAARRCNKERGDHLKALYSRVKGTVVQMLAAVNIHLPELCRYGGRCGRTYSIGLHTENIDCTFTTTF